MFVIRSLTLIVISITLISLLTVGAVDTFLIYAQNQTKYAQKLVGKSVVPPVNTTASGRAIIFVGDDWLWWKLNVTGITDPTMAHMHMGKRGVNGEIVANLWDLLKSAPNFENPTERTIITGNISASDLQGPMKGKTFADLQSAIKALSVYIDLHTGNHPDGELRGTLKIQDGKATAPIASKNNTAPSS